MTFLLARLDELEELEKKATPGPWKKTADRGCVSKVYDDEPWHKFVVYGGRDDEGIIEKSDRVLIVQSRNVFPHLLAALRVAINVIIQQDQEQGHYEGMLCGYCDELKRLADILGVPK